MALRGTDLAILSARFGVARFGASRFGFCPDDVEGTDADEPGEYVWKEVKPPVTLWTLQSLYGACGERPVAAFTDLPDPTAADVEFQLTDASTPAELISYWLWDFGDGNTSLDQNPTHSYSTPGEYTITLYVAGIRGSASATGLHTVISGPTAAFTWDQPAENDPVDFTDTSVEGSGTIDTWLWDFGDTETSAEQNPTHSYAAPGDYTVTLTVTDDNDLTDDFTDTVSPA